ncbi:Bromodomain-containing protein [Dunaliella salina]|uniref:Bromodomain-containing protein n=1 Tax=Dunaliella salina TaxID=3046 RepID=A0ABQ7G2S6_DUNSA|nr:Bromodomain-containing protein [Dunaliella salina]|eukprot:KAF5828893.1 Bromodomain-containing protein [Dunaliella salina]
MSADAHAGPQLSEDAVLDGFLKECMNMIKRRLWSKRECSAFKEPVDPIKLNIPDYHTYIKHPMDVGTVKKKLDSGMYKSPLEVRDDVRLVWRNCAAYNPPGHPMRNMGDILAAAWEATWKDSNIEERWFQHLQQQDLQASSHA